MTITGVLLAAGRGSRMGQTKQLLPWKGSTVIEASFDAIAKHCDAMVVVLGADSDVITKILTNRTFSVVISDPDAEQFHSTKLGLAETDGDVLLHLADHPIVPDHVLPTMLNFAADRAIIPTVGETGGHPIYIPQLIVEQILASTNDGGLRQYWEEHPQFVTRKPMENAQGLLIDLDTPEDYARAQQV